MKQARRLDHILKLKQPERMHVIGAGLERLGAHVAQLEASTRLLQDDGQVAGAAAMNAICVEESAKVLILLDICRTFYSPRLTAVGCRYFYNHLARCIYAAVHSGRPADFAEVEGYIEEYRDSHYLDGPNDVDWIWRNDLIRRRENALYVDYEETDDAYMWTGGDPDLVQVDGCIPELVLAMKTCNLLNEQGAGAIAAAWNRAEFDSKTRWEFCRERNWTALRSLVPEFAPKDEAEQLSRALSILLDRWTFPLLHLDLRERIVPFSTLRAEQERGHG